jgi:dephospho-CoA kinase
MLFVGLAGHGSEHPVAGRLTRLGAVPGRIETPPSWDVAEPSVFILTGTDWPGGRCWPGLHIVITTAAVPTADAMVDEKTGQIDQLWADRLMPFEANLRASRRAPRRQDALLTDPDRTWPVQAHRLIGRLRFSAGGQIIRVDHIGSTSVPGLPAKQLIDIQVVVADLARAVRVAEAARRAGFVHVPGQWFGTDRHGVDHAEEVVVDADPGRPVNINIRPADAPIWRETLLFRDWLRSHDDERDAYAAMKRQLAQRPDHGVDDYGSDKMPWISAALARAEDWAAAAGWSP